MIQEFIDDHNLFHTTFQQDYLITKKSGITLYGQYKQALREWFKRRRGLRELYCDKEILEIEIQELEFEVTKQNISCYEVDKKKVEIKRKTMRTEENNKTICDTEKEYSRFFQQVKILKEQLGTLTPERVEKLDREFWEAQVKSRLANHAIARSSGMRIQDIELLNCYPREMRLKIYAELKDTQKLVDDQTNRDIDLTFNQKQFENNEKILLD